MNLPSISIIIPTLNSEKVIGDCLKSIAGQDYPKDKIEIIIVDGGSVDKTLEIINSISAFGGNINVLTNKLKTGEAGKAVGLKAAKGEIVAFIDSDNILSTTDWLKRMVEPFSDSEIIACEPIEYTYRKTDGYITRYCALMGMNDPICLFLGNYDRYNGITGKWTELPHKEEDRGGYLKIELKKDKLPTIGANGFLIRRDILNTFEIGDYLFDIDVIADLQQRFYSSVKVAKVKVGIIHIFAGGFLSFVHKQKRRIRDYAYYKKLGLRRYQWGKIGLRGIIKFVLYVTLLLPLLFQSLKGYAKKKDSAWFFHVPACLTTLIVYTSLSMQNLFAPKPLSRDRW